MALLTARGKEQAQKAANWIPCEKPEVLLASAASRVRATAEIIAESLKLDIKIVPNLNEQQSGSWEGKSYLEIKKAEPELYHQWCQDPIRNAAPGGESIARLYERVVVDLEKVIAEHTGKRLVIVTHAGVIKSAIIHALGMPIDNFWRLSIPTGSASKIDYSTGFATMQYASLRL